MRDLRSTVDLGNFSADPVQSFTMPSALYVDPSVLEHEREAIFWRNWIFVCHESEIAELGAYVTADIVGQPVFVVRSDDGEIRAFYNVCQHRGHLLLEGSGTIGQRITCPYHAWAYDSHGQLRGARMSDRMESFDFDDFTPPCSVTRSLLRLCFRQYQHRGEADVRGVSGPGGRASSSRVE